MSYIDKVQVKGTDYDIRDNRMKLKDQVSHGFRNNIVSSTSRGGVFNSFRNQFKSTVASTTSITISTGAATKNGLYYSTVSDQTITIPLASSGNARKDLIVVRWEIRDNSESTYGQLVRIAGTEVTKTGSASAIPEPSYNDSVVNVDILTPGKTYTVDLPLYMVIVDGTNGIIEVGKIFSEIYDNSYLSDKITELDTAVNKLNTDTGNIISGYTIVPFATRLKGIDNKHTLSFKWDTSDLNNVKLVFYIDDIPMRKI